MAEENIQSTSRVRGTDQPETCANQPPGPVVRNSKRRFFIVVYLLFLLLFTECGSRAFWWMRGVPLLTAPRQIHRSFYPKLAELQRNLSTHDTNCLDVLMLGGSVLHNDYGDIEHILRERLSRATKSCVHIHNLSEPAHTTLDSYYKYKHLSEHHFDVVVIYHGINEIRANNCPTSDFQTDYSHLSWYQLINDYEARSESRWFIAPYTIKFITFKALARLGWGGFLPTHEPTPASLEFGCDVKTAVSFKLNLERLLKLAAQRNEPVVLMTFAYHLPKGYSREAFDNHQLDYTTHALPIELWGKSTCVVKALDVHNEVISNLSKSSPGVTLVDQKRQIPAVGRLFNDICHFTHEGCEKFVDYLLPTIVKITQ